MKVAIASGKGGTGKSTVSTNLAYLLSKKYDDVTLFDCDVEEPNCHIFLKPSFNKIEKVCIPIPEINQQKCIGCGKCAEVCQFNALAFIKDKVIKFPELCHGCGSCTLACPVNAVEEGEREIGTLEQGEGFGIGFVHGKMRIGEAMSPPLIKAVKKCSKNDTGDEHKIQLLDCPPGTSCPAIAAVSDTNYVFMVTEPTPFGLYDLQLAVDVMRKLGLSFGIVINRSDENDNLIENYAKNENIEILARIPDRREIAECYSKGELVLKALPEYADCFEPLVQAVERGVK